MFLFSHTYSHVSRCFSFHPFCSSKRPLIHSHSLHTNTVIMVNGVEPNQAKWRISAASVLSGVSAFRDWSNLFLGVTTLPIMTECNQQVVCWMWRPPNRMKKHDNKHNFTSLFSVVLPPLSAASVITSSRHRCLSQTDRAVQLLLETSADNPSYYCDSLKACLVTTITSSGPSQSTIKLVATNMIANGKLAGIVSECLLASDLLPSFF